MKTERKQEILSKIEMFYSINEEKFLIIPKYYINGSGSLTQLINNLTDIEDIVSEITGNINNNVYASEIYHSSRYKSKWAFVFNYSKDLPLPENTFELGNNWNISKWINN